MKTILIGSVRSSQTILNEMIRTNFPITMVFSLDEECSVNVSGYCPIHEVADEHGIQYVKFKKISDEENIRIIKEIEPDYIFAIGISQLIPQKIIDLAKVGCIGFHPTPLPKYRGRAALVWQILLGVRETKCTFFFLDAGMDSGAILGQEEYVIEEDDYVNDVSLKLNEAIKKLSNKLFKQIIDGTLHPVKQNEAEASYLLIRRPEDGEINWSEPVEKIQRLIRAVSKPYPGAFSMYDGKHKFIIWRAEYLNNTKYIGIPGQICEISDKEFAIVGIDGLIRVTEYENQDNVKLMVGHKFK